MIITLLVHPIKRGLPIPITIKCNIHIRSKLAESLLDNWLKNNHITVDKIYCHRSLFVFFYEFQFSNLFLNRRNDRHKNKILWHFAKIRLERISQSNGSIGRPLGFVIDSLNTSPSLCRIAPCLMNESEWTCALILQKGGKFLKKLGGCVGGSITRLFISKFSSRGTVFTPVNTTNPHWFSQLFVEFIFKSILCQEFYSLLYL